MKARASSIKPKETLIVLSHPPDFGNELSHPGNIANNAKGNAKASANPLIPAAGPSTLLPFAASTNNVPIIGPVHENETRLSVNAMKKIPINPPLSLAWSALLIKLLGSVISNAPKNEIANIKKMIKNSMLKKPLLANAFNASEQIGRAHV